jgi:hypothetical protein
MPSEGGSMTSRFECVLILADEPACQDYAKVTIVDAAGDKARACVGHAIAALFTVNGARVDWDDSRGLNDFEGQALKIADQRAALRPAGWNSHI